jgi:hypothetical protein
MDKIKVEYLIIFKSQKNICDNKETYNNLITSNSKFKITKDKLLYDSLEISYSVKIDELQQKDQRFFHVTFICSEFEKITEFSNLLRDYRITIGNLTKDVYILWDDISRYYSIISYPLISEIENLMRKLITNFLVINVGADWIKETIPSDVQNSIREDNKKKIDTNFFHGTDFIQLLYALTTETKFETKSLIEKIKKASKIDELDINELKKIVPKSNWEMYFSKKIDCDVDYLKKQWNRLYELRCLVAHNNLVTFNDYQEIKSIVDDLKNKLQRLIDELDSIEVEEENKELVAENIVSNLNILYGSFIETWKELEKEILLVSNDLLEKKEKIVNIFMLLDKLQSRNLITQSLQLEIRTLMSFRNAIVHHSDIQITETETNIKINQLKNIIEIFRFQTGKYKKEQLISQLLEKLTCLTKKIEFETLVKEEISQTVNKLKEYGYIIDENNKFVGGQKYKSYHRVWLLYLYELDYIQSIYNQKPFSVIGNIDASGERDDNIEIYFTELNNKIITIVNKLID